MQPRKTIDKKNRRRTGTDVSVPASVLISSDRINDVRSQFHVWVYLRFDFRMSFFSASIDCCLRLSRMTKTRKTTTPPMAR